MFAVIFLISSVPHVCSSFVASSPLSGALKKCDARRENDLGGCLQANLNVIIPSLKTGWEWLNLPGMDPVVMPLKLSPSYHDGNLTLDLIITNSALYGLSTTTTVSVRSKAFRIGKLEVVTTTPTVTYTGSYTSEGYTGLFPLHSSGSFNITLVDVNTAWIAYFTKMNISGRNYLRVDSLKLDAMPVQILLDGAHSFDGSNEIAQDMKTSLNTNSNELYNLLKPELMHFMSLELMGYINILLGTTPLDDLVGGLELQDWKRR